MSKIKGFTLIELLGIITLIGIILLVAVPFLIESNRQASDNSGEDLKENLAIAVQNYMSTCDSLGLCTEDKKEEYNKILNGEGTGNIKIQVLIDNGFIKDGDLPENITPTSEITVKKQNGKIIVGE